MEEQEQIEREVNQDELHEVTGGNDNNNSAAILGGAGMVAASAAVVGGLATWQMVKIAKNTKKIASEVEYSKFSLQGLNNKADTIGTHFVRNFPAR